MALNSKRMQTFFNEFLISTTTFLNQFMTDCEDKFFEFERKLNRIESNLIIIEAKLASVPIEQTASDIQPPVKVTPEVSATVEDSKSNEEQNLKVSTTPEISQPAEEISKEPQPPPPPTVQVQPSNMIKISESAAYKKFFKMLKFGVPPQGVKNKMFSEGFDGSLLDNPELLIEKTPEDDEIEEME